MLKKLAAFLGFLCLVLLLLAFDEGQMERGVDAVRTQLEPAVQRLRERAPVLRPRSTSPVTAGSHAIVGDFVPEPGDAPGGRVRVDGAVLVFEAAPAVRTRPHRIAMAGDAAVQDLGLPSGRQVELREIVPLDARTPVGPSPLCAGAAPGWLAVARSADGLRLQVWPVGPAPDAVGAVACGRFAYEDAGG